MKKVRQLLGIIILALFVVGSDCQLPYAFHPWNKLLLTVDNRTGYSYDIYSNTEKLGVSTYNSIEDIWVTVNIQGSTTFEAKFGQVVVYSINVDTREIGSFIWVLD